MDRPNEVAYQRLKQEDADLVDVYHTNNGRGQILKASILPIEAQ